MIEWNVWKRNWIPKIIEETIDVPDLRSLMLYIPQFSMKIIPLENR
jgi:hypothetical protein